MEYVLNVDIITVQCVLVADLTLESFPADFEERKVLYWHGVDKDSRKICTCVVL